jgi:hypothetical protein
MDYANTFVELDGKRFPLSDYPRAYIDFMVSEHGGIEYASELIAEWGIPPHEAPVDVIDLNRQMVSTSFRAPRSIWSISRRELTQQFTLALLRASTLK